MTTKFQLTKIRWIGDTLVQRPKKCTFFLIKSKKPICVLFSVAQTSGKTNSDREVPNFPPGGKVTWLRIRQWILRPSTLDERRCGSKVTNVWGAAQPIRGHNAATLLNGELRYSRRCFQTHKISIFRGKTFHFLGRITLFTELHYVILSRFIL